MEKEFLTDKAISSLYSESVGEYSLPDYHTDVKKLLLIKVRAVPSGKFINSDSIEFSGTVCYDIVYLDSENRVTGCAFSTDYEVAVKCQSDGIKDSFADTRVANFSVRLVGPRRFTTKASLNSSVHIIEPVEYAVAGDGAEGAGVQTLNRCACVRQAVFGEERGAEQNTTLAELEGVIADECEVIAVIAEPRVTSHARVDGGVEYQGEVAVSALVNTGAEAPLVYKKAVPVSGNVECEGVDAGTELLVSLTADSARVTVNATEDGVELALTLTTSAAVRGFSNEKVELVTDLYRTDVPVENEYADFTYTEHITAHRECVTFSETVNRAEEGSENIRNFLLSVAEPRIDVAEPVDGGVKIKGDIRFSGVACEVFEDGSLGYSSVKYTVPFEQNVNINCQIPEGAHINCAAECRDAALTLDGGKVYLDCRVQLDLISDAQRRVGCVASCSVSGEPFAKCGSVITVYYPEAGESLFGIAKRYHTSVGAIAEDNSLSESVFSDLSSPILSSGVKRLIIK